MFSVNYPKVLQIHIFRGWVHDWMHDVKAKMRKYFFKKCLEHADRYIENFYLARTGL